MSVYHLHAWSPQRPEESLRSPGTEVRETAVSHHVGARMEPRCVEEQPVLLTAEPSPAPVLSASDFKL